jgi:hypothetical protein
MLKKGSLIILSSDVVPDALDLVKEFERKRIEGRIKIHIKKARNNGFGFNSTFI